MFVCLGVCVVGVMSDDLRLLSQGVCFDQSDVPTLAFTRNGALALLYCEVTLLSRSTARVGLMEIWLATRRCQTT